MDTNKNMTTLGTTLAVTALGGLLGIAATAPAAAHGPPSYAQADSASAQTATAVAQAKPNVAAATPPSYASRSTDEKISGTISSLNGKYTISVRDDRGYIDNVTLHDGTIINPTGLTLAPGQNVTILGRPNGPTFDANQIDTPYQTVYAVPVYPAYGWDYPGYGYGYGFGYPAYRFGLGFHHFGLGLRG